MKYSIFFFLLLAATVGVGQTTTVKPIANGQSKFLGCAWSSAQNTGFPNLWNQITPENGGKWGSVERTRGVMSWSDMDAAYSLAQKYGMIFKEHTLIWGAQQPSWIATLDTAAQRQEIEQWFSLMAARYKDIKYIDVVNEPLHNAPNGMVPWGTTTKNVDYAKALGGAGQTGWDWIIKSFRMARKYFPTAKLILNEYSVINSSTTTQNYLKIIKLLQAEKLIDGIGEQAHAFTTAGTSTTTMKANLDALGATGLPIYLTEMDVDGATDLAQLKEMQRIFPLFWKHPSIQGITMWGFRYGMWRTDQGAYLVNQNGTERPALKWLKAYVNDSLVSTQSITVAAADGSTAITTKGASLNMVAQVLPANTTIPNVTWSVSPTSVATIDAAGKLTALADGKVTVTATAWDGSGVKGTASITVSNQTATGLNDLSFNGRIKVYPNPAANGQLTISGSENIQQIEIINLLGQTVYECSRPEQPVHQMQLRVPAGIYFLNLSDGVSTLSEKIVIQ